MAPKAARRIAGSEAMAAEGVPSPVILNCVDSGPRIVPSVA
jgi:hypothetical protein